MEPILENATSKPMLHSRSIQPAHCNDFHYSYGTSLDIVWIIWFQHIQLITHAKPYETGSPIVGDYSQCLRMTDAALEHGAMVDESICWNSDRASVLFEVNDYTELRKDYSGTAFMILNYLINKGYDLEKRNFRGLTPFLHSVQAFQPQSLECVEVFISRGANLNAVNHDGQGALHIALLRPYRHYSFEYLNQLASAGAIQEPEEYWNMKLSYATDRDFDIECSRGPHHKQHLSGYTEKDHAVSAISNASLGTLPDLRSDLPDFIRCKDYDDVEHTIRHPIKVLRMRLKLVLLTLLRAGCDPNVLDDQGNPPSFYARRNRSWPEWSWALQQAGYGYDMISDQWVQPTAMECI